jgi:hypothetical protein
VLLIASAAKAGIIYRVPSLLNRITPQRVFIWLTIVIGIVFGPVVVYFMCTYGLPTAFITAGLLLVATWAFIARDRWWIPLPVAITFGGGFYYGFKIQIHEMALLICLFPLVLALATRWQGAITGRSKVPASVSMLVIYLILHWIGSLTYNQLMGLGGIGNVSRYYMNAFWPFILFYAYYYFGNSKYTKAALTLMYVANIGRVLIGVYTVYDPGFIYIPGLNFFPAAAGGSSDLRNAAYAMATLSAIHFCLYRGFILRLINGSVFLASFPLLVLGGGRLSIVLLMLMVLGLSILYRKILLITLFGVAVSTLVTILNLNPTLIEDVPKIMQRSLSGLILTEKHNLEVKQGTEISDQWHYRLQAEGRKRWLHSLPSILVGNGFRPYVEEDFAQGNFEDMLKTAILTCSYESSLWHMLTAYGLIGCVLYFNVVYFFAKNCFLRLWKNKISDVENAFSYMLIQSVISWIMLCPFAGTVPSGEIMNGLFVQTIHDDRLKEERLKEEEEAAKKAASGAGLAEGSDPEQV